MKKCFLTFLMLFVFCASHAQDGHAWTFRFTFKLDLNDRPDYEFFLNDVLSFGNYRNSNVSFDQGKKQYTLTIHYNCISCDYAGSNMPPELYIKVNRMDMMTRTKYMAFVPVYFEKSDDWSFKEMDDRNIEAIDLDTLPIDAILQRRGVIPSMDVIKIRADRSLHFRNENECRLKKMTHLVPVTPKP